MKYIEQFIVFISHLFMVSAETSNRMSQRRDKSLIENKFSFWFLWVNFNEQCKTLCNQSRSRLNSLYSTE